MFVTGLFKNILDRTKALVFVFVLVDEQAISKLFTARNMAMIFSTQLKPVLSAVLYGSQGFILSGHREKRSYANLKTNKICNSL